MTRRLSLAELPVPVAFAGLAWHMEEPAAVGGAGASGSGMVGLLQGGAEEIVHHRLPARCGAAAAGAGVARWHLT
jgi:hypothetical protein